jgi:flagellar hook-associated protein 3 FlgL
MAILPTQVARVSNTLRLNIAQRSLTSTQAALTEVQNQLATGKRLNTPSDSPSDAATVLQLRKMLEQQKVYAQNIKYANSQLSEVDSTLGDLTDLLQEAQTTASANVGSDVTADQRSEAATVIDSLYNQVIALANRQFRGAYLFAGDRSSQAPFVSDLGGVQFVGSQRGMSNTVDENTALSFMVDGTEVFGGLSTRGQGTVDLSPKITPQTRLSDLRGATEQGVRLGSIVLSDGTTSKTVDLSQADTVGDVIQAIHDAGVGSIDAAVSADGNSLLLSSSSGADSIAVSEVGGGTTAADLGILTATPTAPGAPLDGSSLNAQLTADTLLADLREGLGIDTSHGLVITNGVKAATIDLTAATTVQDLINAINDSGNGVLASINADGTGLDVLNSVQGLGMTIAENGGTTAADLGIRSFHANTPLSELNNGKGVRTFNGPDIQITRRDGTQFSVDLSGLNTVQDVIDAINSADAGGGITASFATTGNGIVLTDSTGATTSNLSVTALNASMAAQDLGIAGSGTDNVLTGKDVNPAYASGIFGNLAKLRDAFMRNDQQGITEAAEALHDDQTRVVRINGNVGARVNDLESRQERLEDQNLATQALLSTLEDTDYTSAITQYQTLQTALQANLQTAGRMLNLSLLDFLD